MRVRCVIIGEGPCRPLNVVFTGGNRRKQQAQCTLSESQLINGSYIQRYLQLAFRVDALLDARLLQSGTGAGLLGNIR